MPDEKQGFGHGSGPRFITLEYENVADLEARLGKEALDDYVVIGFAANPRDNELPWAVLLERRDLHFR
ncbi:MAG: hypothetical protein ABSF46_00805 [Terriglobia bacterium]|jgi:hypothetical protein